MKADATLPGGSHPETQTEWEERMGKEILEHLKNEIYLDLPFLDLALSALTPVGKEELISYATDGSCLYFGPEHMIQVFKRNEQFLERAYLHSVLHCIYGHLWLGGVRERGLWNLSCDIAVEYVLDHLNKPCTKRILSWQRQQFYEMMERERLVSAAEIYEVLRDAMPGKAQEATDGEKTGNQQENGGSRKSTVLWNIQELQREFVTDDHRFWPAPENPEKQPNPQQSKPQQQWQKIARQMQQKKDKRGSDPKEGEQLLYTQITTRNGRRTYGDFLRQFAVRREELRLNPDEFDLAYYTYGLERYGNIPLIEPLETREDHKIQELIIVVDTSYSTSGELVEGFLKETFTILKEKDAFFQNYKVHVLQCDDEVRQDVEITNEAQMDQLIREFQLQGGGNTDFRPAFTYVKELRDQGRLKNPGGLLYFTDGNGIYPKKKPDFKTAFLFLDHYDPEKVPAWAMRLEVDKEELRHAGNRNSQAEKHPE